MPKQYMIRFQNVVSAFKNLQQLYYPEVTEDNDNGEWEIGVTEFTEMCTAYLLVVENVAYDLAYEDVLNDMLYAIARDNESSYLIEETLKHPEWFGALCRHCISSEYSNAKWQFASCLPKYAGGTELDSLIFDFLECGHEYTERMALHSLVQIAPEEAEKYAELFWNRNKYKEDEYQKMMVLDVLEAVKSPKLNEYLQKAMETDYEYLKNVADKIKLKL